LTTVFQNESGECIFNLAVVSEEGNVMVSWFWHSHENEGWVHASVGLVREMTSGYSGKLNGCGLYKQGLMEVAIFNGSTVGKIMGVGFVKITPNCIFGPDEEEG
jgi:hypothetical protein